MNAPHDIAVVGGGLVGLAAALALNRRRESWRIVLLEKEEDVGRHQSGHNTGVIHTGVYYKPGSLKARLCVEGARRMLAFCAEQQIPVETCGKVIVAFDESEAPQVDAIFRKAVANGVPRVERIDRERLRAIEPRATGHCAVYAPTAAIVEYPRVAQAMARILESRGVSLMRVTRVKGVATEPGGVRVLTTQGDLRARYLVNCAGLYCDVVAAMMGLKTDVRIIPLRGEYYVLKPERRAGIHGMIFAVPDPRFPLVGVHFTPKMNGQVVAGPNAVLAFAREGYSPWTINPRDLLRMLAYRGFWSMVRKYWRTGVGEFWRSVSKAAFVRSMQRLIPDLTESDVVREGSGVRAQAVDTAGELIDDFRFVETPEALHVLNAPSPAATASLAIGEYIADKVLALRAD